MDELTKEFIAESQEGLERMELCLTELEKRPDDGELVAEIFRTVHTIKGTTSFLGFSRLETLAHAGEGLLAALRDGKIAVTCGLVGGLLELMDGLRRILRLIEATGSEGVRSTDSDRELIALLVEFKAGRTDFVPQTQPSPEVPPTQIPTAQNSGVRNPPASTAISPVTLDKGTPPLSPAPGPSAPSAQDRTLRIDVDVLNRMVNLVGELVLTRNQILQSSPGGDNFPDLARRLNTVTSELRESVMRARMQPVGHLFSKFPRMVRDLAMTCGRKVRIEFEGQETGLDKSLLEAIRDPLTHAVRNSVDHGIESPADRLKAGKPLEGVVRLRAFHQNGSVVIEVIDDGAGISTERVLAKAIERALITPAQAASMPQRDVLQMIFKAGFSTAKQVTSVSGRGVGMDVVRANVEQVGGSVELESRAGLGTTLRLRVPLTLAIVPALVVRSGGENFAMPQSALVELVDVPRREVESSVERIGTAELYRLRGSLLPLVWLDRLLGLPSSESEHSNGFYIAVVESEGCRFGLVVDNLKAPEEIVVKPLSAVLREIGVFSGATVLGSGALAMILDVAAVGARAGVRSATEPVSANSQDLARLLQAPQLGQARIEMESAMVIYESWKRGPADTRQTTRVAIPLSAVERIESIPLSEIEYAGGRAMLQYGGELIPLEDDDDVLFEMRAATSIVDAPVARAAYRRPGFGALSETPASTGRTVTVLICARPGAHLTRRIGMIVRRVLDVSEGTLLASDADLSDSRLAMIDNRVTMVHRELAGQALAPAPSILQEVA